MPRVPVITENRVGLAETTDAKFRAADFGSSAEAVGRSISQLGQAGSQFVEQQDKIYAQLDAAGAQTLDVEAMGQIRGIRESFLSQEGFNAANARGETEKQLREVQTGLLARASTPRMKRALAPILASRIEGALGDISSHVRTQVGKAEDDASLSRWTASAEEAEASLTPEARATNIATGLGEMENFGRRKGWDPATLKTEKFKYESGIHSAVARNMIDSDNLDGAMGYIKEHASSISDKDQGELMRMLKAPLQQRESNGDVDRAMGSSTGGDTSAPFSYADPRHGAGQSPVAGGQYGASRDYGSHHGVDLPAPNGTALFPTRPGTVTVSSSKLGGNIVTVDHGGGVVSKYMHLGSVKVKDGDTVTPDTVIGTVGMTGRSTGPHVHWEVRENGKPVDPEKLVGQVQQAPQRHDLNAVYGQIDAIADKEQWTPERRERAKSEADRRVSRDEKLLTRQEDAAERAALDKVATLGDRFTSMGQLGSVAASLSSAARLRLTEAAASNAKPKAVAADGDTALSLNLLALTDPAKFAQTDLRGYQHAMTRSEFASLATLQVRGKVDPKGPEATSHSAIWGTISRYAPDLKLDLGTSKGVPNNADDRKSSMRIFSMMETELNGLTGGKRQPNDDEVKAAFDHAVLDVKTVNHGWFGDKTEVAPRFKVPEGQTYRVPIPDGVHSRIVQSFKAEGVTPNESQIGQFYMQHKGRPGFWP